MIKVSKNAKVITTLVLLVLAFFCSFNITYSYFTATANLPGQLNFSDLDVRFVVTDTVDNKLTELPTEDYTQDNLYTITLYPLGASIPRGESFKFSYSNAENATEVNSLEIKIMNGSCDAFVRFWIDAYIKTGDTLGTENYGKYFSFTSPSAGYVAQGGVGTSELSKSCYYVTGAMMSGDVNISLGNSLTISSDIPDAALGNQLQITISLQAIQAANNVYNTAAGFNDERSYYADWSDYYND